MGGIWLGSLPDVLRSAGLNVDTYPGWEARSRLSGGYDALLGIQMHHTASSGRNPAREMAYMWDEASSRPIGACYIWPSGKWTVGAAGATNTSGKGGPLETSRGVIPKDAANRYVISLEAANPGDGSIRWPDAQLDSYIRGVAALNVAYFDGRLDTAGDVHSHFEWTPRKVDCAGASWYATGSAKWNMIQVRNDVKSLITPKPVPEGDHSVLTHLIQREDDPAVFAQFSGGYKTWVPDEPTRDVLILLHGKKVQEIPRGAVALWKASGPVLGPIPPGYDGWGLRVS